MIISFIQLLSLFVLIEIRKMYWSDWYSPAKIEVANMDGTERQVLVEGGHLMWPNGLSIDYDTRKLYWADARSNTIERIDLDGLNHQVVLQGLPHPFGLDVHKGFIYWTDWISKDIRRANINDSSSVQVLRSGLSGLMGIKLYDPDRQNGETSLNRTQPAVYSATFPFCRPKLGRDFQVFNAMKQPHNKVTFRVLRTIGKKETIFFSPKLARTPFV